LNGDLSAAGGEQEGDQTTASSATGSPERPGPTGNKSH
jgi:hypothetical protein